MLTILFDGIAYGMLLFVLACGLAVTLGLMNFVNLAHGAFAMAGGYVTVAADEPPRRAVPRDACRSPSSSPALVGVAARAHALRPTLRARAISTRCCSRSASSSWRSRPSTMLMGSTAADHPAAGLAAGPLRGPRRRHRALPAASSSSSAACSRSRCSSVLTPHALRQPAARRGRRSRAWRAASASVSTASSR